MIINAYECKNMHTYIHVFLNILPDLFRISKCKHKCGPQIFFTKVSLITSIGSTGEHIGFPNWLPYKKKTNQKLQFGCL